MAIPTLSVAGWMVGRWLATDLGKWGRRGAKFGLAIVAPIVGCAGIVHFNKNEIYRIGKSTLSQLEDLRRAELPPFNDAAVREEWDKRMDSKQFRLFRSGIDPNELKSQVDFQSIVDDSIRK